jgi:O-antigen/teichoic acid export membrane protein
LFAGQGILNTVLTVLLNLLFLLAFDMGITGYVLSVVLADALTTVFLVFRGKLWRSVKPNTVKKSVMRSMLSFCLPLIPTTVFWWVTSVSDRYLVAYLASPEINGLYAAAYKIPTLLIYAVSIFDGAWKLSAIGETDDKDVCTAFFSRVWKMYITFAFVAGAVLILLCRLFSGILFSDAYNAAWVYIPILCAATVFTALDTFLGSVYYTCKKTVYSLRTAFVGALLNIALNIFFIPRFGAIGASAATLVSYLAVFVIRLATITKLIPFRQERVRAAINTILICIMAATMTMTGQNYAGFWWFFTTVSFVLILVYNFKDVLRLVKGTIGMLRRK